VTSKSGASRDSTIDDATWRPFLAPGIQYQETDDEVILLDKENQRVHQLNRVGATVLRYCDGRHEAADIVNLLLQEFEVDSKRLSEDVVDLLQKLKSVGILE